MRPVRTLILLSGGLDSTAAAFQSVKDGDPTEALWIDYGQTNGDREGGSARAAAAALGIPLHECRVYIDPISTGPTARADDLAVRTLDEIRRAEGTSPAYAPGRNAILIAIGVSYAQHLELTDVVIGCNGDDAAFPDCSPAFVDAIDRAAQIGSGIRVRAPLNTWPKSDVVLAARNLGCDLAAAWTCYRGGSMQCGVCDACAIRRDAFDAVNEEDPTRYGRG